MRNKLTELANKIVMVRKQQGGVISPPTVPFFPDDHLLGKYAVPTYPQPLTYKSGAHTGAMVALFLPATYARKYALSAPGAVDPSEMHITLAYLGKADQITPYQIDKIHEFMELVSEHHPPLTGTINGCGRFCNGDDDGDPFIIIPDLPDLPNLRELIVLWLRGNDIPVGHDHGFTPHITLTYLPHAEYNPFDRLDRAPVSFPVISLVLAGERYDYPLNGGMETKADLDTLVSKHLSGKHSQKTHAGKKAKGKKGAAKKKPTGTASSIIKELPANLGLMDRKKKTGIINQLSDLSTDELEKAFTKNNKALDNPKNDLELRNALIFGKILEDATKKKKKKLATKAALITKIGARHTGAECAVIQKMHDLTLELGAECHPMSRRAGARHSHADQGMVQRIHDDCADLGATCKASPAKDDLYHSQILKEGASTGIGTTTPSQRLDIIKAQSDAPNYAPASTPQRCENCIFFRGDPGEDYCTRFDFTADQDYICDTWEAGQPDEIPGYVANKGDLAALTEGVLKQRGLTY